MFIGKLNWFRVFAVTCQFCEERVVVKETDNINNLCLSDVVSREIQVSGCSLVLKYHIAVKYLIELASVKL